jgi:hypothetical protein
MPGSEKLEWSEWENVTGAKYVCSFGKTINLTISADWEDDFWYIYVDIGGRTIGEATDPSLENARNRAKAFAIETWKKWLEELQKAN